ncbi:MAG TPA: hypothetical protein VMU47_22580 [Caldimonas sp.]|nr:hypothetical protein [Caldimonas sp.]
MLRSEAFFNNLGCLRSDGKIKVGEAADRYSPGEKSRLAAKVAAPTACSPNGCMGRRSRIAKQGKPRCAGWKAALIKREGKDVLGIGPQPQIIGADLHNVADQLIAQRKERANAA